MLKDLEYCDLCYWLHIVIIHAATRHDLFKVRLQAHHLEYLWKVYPEKENEPLWWRRQDCEESDRNRGKAKVKRQTFTQCSRVLPPVFQLHRCLLNLLTYKSVILWQCFGLRLDSYGCSQAAISKPLLTLTLTARKTTRSCKEPSSKRNQHLFLASSINDQWITISSFVLTVNHDYSFMHSVRNETWQCDLRTRTFWLTGIFRSHGLQVRLAKQLFHWSQMASRISSLLQLVTVHYLIYLTSDRVKSRRIRGSEYVSLFHRKT